MSWIFAGTLVPSGLAATAFAALLLAVWMTVRLRSYRSNRVVDLPSGVGQGALPPSTYGFMSLLSDEDFDFLASLPGYKPEIGKKLRRHHERILRLYLRELAREFHSVHAEAREIVATAGAEHAPTVGLLLRQQVVFWQSMARIELSFAVPSLSASRGNKARAAALNGLVEAILALRAAVEQGVGQRTAEAL
jgi:hypothetical protein